jgi:MinD superfamily P-loop ATPase
LPPHPQLAGHERQLADGVSDEFEPLDADAVRNGAHDAGYQLVIADLGSVLEAGHRRLLDVADVVVGVVRPTLESLPDVLRLTGYLRAVDLGRKLVLVANACDDNTELRTLAHEAGVPLVATIPPSAAFSTAADRHQPAWRTDPALRAAMLPLARCIWPLDTLEAPARPDGLAGLVHRALSLAGRRAR